MKLQRRYGRLAASAVAGCADAAGIRRIGRVVLCRIGLARLGLFGGVPARLVLGCLAGFLIAAPLLFGSGQDGDLFLLATLRLTAGNFALLVLLYPLLLDQRTLAGRPTRPLSARDRPCLGRAGPGAGVRPLRRVWRLPVPPVLRFAQGVAGRRYSPAVPAAALR